MTKVCILFFCIIFTLSCSEQDKPSVTIAINPWPGYEFLYLAEKKHYFKKVGANVKLIQLGSLSDAQRAYINGSADGLTSTLIESIQAQILSGKPLKIVMIPDYSNGGDVIISRTALHRITDLKGHKVGCEVSSLGIFMLQRALAKSGLTLDDVEVVNVEQSDGLQALQDAAIDAFVSYPPVSVEVLKNQEFHVIFSSADIPKEVIDVLSISEQSLRENPGLIKKIYRAWDMALDYYKSNPEQAAAIMAKRENILPAEFRAILDEEIVVMNSHDQIQILSEKNELARSMKDVCNTLIKIGSLESGCEQISTMIYDVSNIQ